MLRRGRSRPQKLRSSHLKREPYVLSNPTSRKIGSNLRSAQGRRGAYSDPLLLALLAQGTAEAAVPTCLLCLAYFFGPRFQVLLYLCHELVGYCAVDQAVVVP